jgi:hypothetical protein
MSKGIQKAKNDHDHMNSSALIGLPISGRNNFTNWIVGLRKMYALSDHTCS